MNKSAFDEWLARIIKSYGKNKLEWPKHVRESYRNTILLEVVEIDGKGKGEHPPSNTGVKIIENQQLPLLVLAERLE